MFHKVVHEQVFYREILRHFKLQNLHNSTTSYYTKQYLTDNSSSTSSIPDVLFATLFFILVIVFSSLFP